MQLSVVQSLVVRYIFTTEEDLHIKFGRVWNILEFRLFHVYLMILVDVTYRCSCQQKFMKFANSLTGSGLFF